MRVLVVLPFPLYAEGGAAARCAIGLLRGLDANGVHASVLCADGGLPEVPAPPEGLNVEVVPQARRSRAHRRLEWLIQPHSSLARDPFGARLRALARDADVVHVCGIHAGALLPLAGERAVAQIDNLTLLDRDIRDLWSHDSRIAIALLRAEWRTRQRARWLIANSREVAAPLARWSRRAHVALAPLSLDPAWYTPAATLEAPTAGLIGTARWPPTANAVSRLLRTVWPLVLEQRPDSRLLLAGDGMEQPAFPDLPWLPGVQWLGRVESASDFLRSLGVLLYPLTRGSGAKVKVLESLALGVPVVTSPFGAEGIVGRGGLVVETGDEQLAEATRALLEDPTLRCEAGDAAAATFAANHAPAVAARRVIELYECILADAKRR